MNAKSISLLLVCLSAAILAGCTSGSPPTPSAQPSPSPTSTPEPSSPPQPTPPPTNSPPTARVGADQVVDGGATVTLDGSASSDADGDAISFTWQQKQGTSVVLSDPAAAVTTFTAPANGTSLSFELTVDDGQDTTIGQTRVSVRPVASGFKIIELRQPSIQDDPAVNGNFPAGFATPNIPDGPRKPGKGAATWLHQIDFPPMVDVELAPGATETVERETPGASVLMGSVQWIGTRDPIAVSLLLDGTPIAEADTYGIGIDRGGADLLVRTTAGGRVTLSVTNTSEVRLSVRIMLGTYTLK